MLFYCLTLCVFLVFFWYLNRQTFQQHKWLYITGTLLIVLTAVAFYMNNGTSIITWLLMLPLLYSVLDDWHHKEFNILLPILSFIGLIINDFSWLYLAVILFFFFILWVFSKFHLMGNGDPYLFLPFFALIPVLYWTDFLLVTFVSALIALIIVKVSRKSYTIPFAPFLLLGADVTLILMTLI